MTTTMLLIILYLVVGVGITGLCFPNFDHLPTMSQKLAMFTLTTVLIPLFFVWAAADFYWRKLWS